MSSLDLNLINDTGLEVASSNEGDKLPVVRFYSECGRVMLVAVVRDFDYKEYEGLMYLSPEEAMRFGKAMEASAIQALKEVAA